MDPLALITAEARARRTVLLTASEADGSVETREIEPYSLRPGKNGPRLFYWCLKKQGTRNTYVSNILAGEPDRALIRAPLGGRAVSCWRAQALISSTDRRRAQLLGRHLDHAHVWCGSGVRFAPQHSGEAAPCG